MESTQKFLNYFINANLKTDGIIGIKSKEALLKATERLKTILENRGFKWLNEQFIFLRCTDKFNNQTTDYTVFIQSGTIAFALESSTRAGDFYVFNPISYGGITGTAVLAEGQYIDTWQGSWQTRFGFKSFELLQVKPVKIWRDGNKNRQIDKNVSQTGLFGINIHTAGWNNIVDRWSAGCIVHPKTQWDEATAYFKLKTYSGTLIEL
jgi:hypothetical protein